MKKEKLQKGQYGYFEYKKKFEIIKTCLFFAIVLVIYITGLILLKTNKNIYTIFAILGVLPASKSAVNMCMYLRYPAAEKSLYEKLAQDIKKGLIIYDLIFVLAEKPVKADCLYIAESQVVLYVRKSKLSEQEITKELKKFLSNHGKGNCSVKVCVTEKSFLEQAKSREFEATQHSDKAVEIKDKLFAFSI